VNGAIVFRWSASIPGREAKGLDVFGQAVARFEGLAKSGRIHAHREFIALTGPEGGFMLVEGKVSELQAILAEPETIALNSKAGAIVQDFTISLYGGGDDGSIQELMGSYATSLGELGYM
jgi:hypothetical protein